MNSHDQPEGGWVVAPYGGRPSPRAHVDGCVAGDRSENSSPPLQAGCYRTWLAMYASYRT